MMAFLIVSDALSDEFCRMNNFTNEKVFIAYLEHMEKHNIPLLNVDNLRNELKFLVNSDTIQIAEEIFARDSKKDSKGAEGGTDIKEFIEEIRIVNEAQRRAKITGKEFKTVCQTGLNTGFSALAFLCATTENVKVVSFDLGNHEYAHEASRLLSKLFPGRHNSIYGDSKITLKGAISKKSLACDFVFIDGGHTKDVAWADIINFRELSSAGTVIVMENCNSWNLNNGAGGIGAVNKAYLQAIEMKYIDHERQVSTGMCLNGGSGDCRELCIGRYVK
jgi:hypothetical protein